MIWKLSKATLTSSRRRTLRALRRNPALTATAVAVAVAATAGAAALGDSVGRAAFAAVASEPALARAVAGGVAVEGAILGVVLAALAPRASALGAQVAAAPVRPASLVLGVRVLPLALGGIVVLVPVVCFVVPASGGAPAGVAVAATAVVAAVAAVAAGAAAHDVVAIWRRAPARAAGGAALLGAAWSIGGGDLLGPFDSLAGALGADASAQPAAVATLAVAAVAAVAASVVAGEHEPTVDATRLPRVLLRVPEAATRAALVAALKALGRERILRRHALWTVAAAVPAAFLATRGLDATAAGVVGVAGGLGIAGGAAFPLAARALTAGGAWFWDAVPVQRGRLRAAAAVAAVLAGGSTVTGAMVAVAPFARADAETYAAVGFAAALTLAAATIAGVVTPWRTDAMADQLMSYSACATLAAGAWLAVGRTVRAAPAPAWVTAAVLAAGALIAAVVASSAVEVEP